MSDTAENPRAVPGGNNPPSPTMPVPPSVGDIEKALRAAHKLFLEDADNWIKSVERAPAEITDEKMAAGFALTISKLSDARIAAEKLHTGIKSPWFAITKSIDAVFLAGVSRRAEAAEKIMLARQKVWIGKQQEIARKAQQAEAARLADIAAKAKEEEESRMREAERLMDSGDMEGAQTAMTEAVALNEQAAEASQGEAQAVERAEGKTADLVRTTHAVGVTTSARTFWNADLLSRAALGPPDQLQFWNTLAPYIGDDVLLKAAKAAARAGIRQCPGLKIFEDFTPINR